MAKYSFEFKKKVVQEYLDVKGGYEPLRNIEKLRKTDIRFVWLLDGLKAPSCSTVSNFTNEILSLSNLLLSA